MKKTVYVLTIESEYSANPEVHLYGTEEEMQREFIRNILEDERDPAIDNEMDPDSADTPPRLSLLRQMPEQGDSIADQFKVAEQIYDAIVEDGTIGLPYYTTEAKEVEFPE